MSFGAAIVDPPWPYQRTSKVGKEGKLTGYSDQVYEPLSLEDLAALPVGRAVSGVLLLWATAPMIPAALHLVEAWDFEYVTQMFWLKAASAPEGTLLGDGEHTAYSHRPHYGVGYWVRGNVEPVIIAKKRGAPSVRTNERSAFVTRRGDHSEKPDTLHLLAEEHLPGPYLELFARRVRPGWTQLGNELEGDGADIRESLAAVCG